ncbi:hypothetical protein WIS52_11315 [Pseudonocardia nematodicida]|uniref:Secreted protein n=1 Tax=Pseudonocardia nematodicida TaxID=1206997 RepID=A0ABV1KA82_9PSEU
MKKRISRSMIAAGAVGAVAFPLAGVAAAQDDDSTQGFPSTQSPTQGVDATGATLDTVAFNLTNVFDDRPDGVNGTDVELPAADPRFVEGPLGGLLVNGPFE